MLLTPHEILKHLGFDIPEEGVQINPDDAYLHSSCLQFIGKTMNADAIPQADLEQMHTGMAGIVAMWRNEPPIAITETSVLKLRTTINVLLSNTYKLRN